MAKAKRPVGNDRVVLPTTRRGQLGVDCDLHRNHNMSYIEFHLDAEQRHKRGQKQRQCPQCKLWVWPDHYYDKTKETHTE